MFNNRAHFWETPHIYRDDASSFSLRKFVSSLPRFDGLEFVSCEDRLHMQPDTRFRNTKDLLPLFYFPNIKTVRATIDNPSLVDASLWTAAYKPMPSNLTSLHRTCVCESFLAEILSATKTLRCLRWEWYYQPESSPLDDPVHVSAVIDLDQFAVAVAEVQDTLLCELIGSLAEDACKSTMLLVTGGK